MRIRNVFIGLAFLNILSACATLSEDQCAVQDWRSVGLADGSSGQAASRLLQHREACIKYAIEIDGEAYRQGYADGLRLYCTGPNGFEQGRRGAAYRNVCHGAPADDFHDGYRDGRKLYSMAANLNRLAGEISSREHQLATTEEDLKLAGLVLISADATGEERKLALADTLTLAKERTQLQEEIEQLVVEHTLHKREMAEFEAQLAWVGY